MQGTQPAVAHLLRRSQGGGVINTAYIERLNATFRQRLSCLTRRSRAAARQPQTLHSAMFVLGCVYNLCTEHHSLRVRLAVGSRSYRWVARTPALASGLTDHCWSLHELFTFQVPPPPVAAPKTARSPLCGH